MTTKSKDRNETVQVWNFRGKYASYMRDLLGDAAPYQKLFDQIYHGYVFCGLYGLLKGKRHIYDPVSDNPDKTDLMVGFRWAYAEKTGIYNYDTMRKLVLLYHRDSTQNFEDKIDCALRFDYPTNDIDDPNLISRSKYGDNSNLIDEYVLGGLDLIHEKVVATTSPQAMIDLMDEMIGEIKEGFESKLMHSMAVDETV